MNSRISFTLILVLLSLLFFASDGFAQGGLSQKSRKDQEKEKQLEQKDRERINKSGIYSLSVWKYDYVFGKPDKKGKQVSFVRYTSKGNKLEETAYNMSDGSVLSKSNNRYDRNGNLTEELKTRGEIKTKTIYRYDSTGNKREVVSYRSDGTVDRKSIFVYDDEGNLVENLGYLADGRLFSREFFVYDSTGNVIEQKNSLTRFTYAYDDDENIVGIVKYGRDFSRMDSLMYKASDRVEFDYDSLGNLRSLTVFKPDSTIRARSKYEYDDEGNVVEETNLSSEGRVDSRFVYQRDRRGNITEESGVEKGRPFKNAYKFDRKGNKKEWIEFDQVNEPRYLTKYIYEKFATKSRKDSVEAPGPVEFIQPDTSEAHVMNEDLFQFLGCRIIASDGTYLGLVWADTSHPHSIVNAWGQYGFDGSPTSIFNPNCPYGGLKGVFSPFNASCPSPPSLYREGKVVSYFTDNTSFSPRVSATRLMTFLTQQSRTRE